MKKNDAPGVAGTMIVAGVLGMLCCAAPLLVVLAAADLAGFFASTGRVLTAALVGLVAVVAFLIARRHMHGGAGSGPRVDEASGHDDCCPSGDWERNPPSAP